jgi:hypothetical protein
MKRPPALRRLIRDTRSAAARPLPPAAPAPGTLTTGLLTALTLRAPAGCARPARCTCHLKEHVTGPVPHHCPACDGDYLSFLALHNCD